MGRRLEHLAGENTPGDEIAGQSTGRVVVAVVIVVLALAITGWLG